MLQRVPVVKKILSRYNYPILNFQALNWIILYSLAFTLSVLFSYSYRKYIKTTVFHVFLKNNSTRPYPWNFWKSVFNIARVRNPSASSTFILRVSPDMRSNREAGVPKESTAIEYYPPTRIWGQHLTWLADLMLTRTLRSRCYYPNATNEKIEAQTSSRITHLLVWLI